MKILRNLVYDSVVRRATWDWKLGCPMMQLLIAQGNQAYGVVKAWFRSDISDPYLPTTHYNKAGLCLTPQQLQRIRSCNYKSPPPIMTGSSREMAFAIIHAGELIPEKILTKVCSPGFHNHTLGYGVWEPKSYPCLPKIGQNHTLDITKCHRSNYFWGKICIK